MEIGAAATRSNPSPPKSAASGLTYRASHSPAEPPGWLGVGARGAGAGERGLKASQALQRPTRAYTPPPVPAEKSSSYPRLHRSAFLFQSAGRLAAPPFSGQARCVERAPLFHLLARLLATLPGPARRCEAGGGFAREPASFPAPIAPLVLLPPASCFSPASFQLSPVATANPRHAVSLSKRLGQPWESRPRALPPRRRRRRGSARGAWHPALPPEQQPGNLRVPPSCGPEVERPGRGPPSTLRRLCFCLRSSKEELSGRREPEDLRPPASNSRAYCLGHRSGGSAIAPGFQGFQAASLPHRHGYCPHLGQSATVPSDPPLAHSLLHHTTALLLL
ncbi:uncharacterized protein LOC130683272 [Manis pentadactyla]|uniref:uncharacterized protein LOC130683272 n=1 Tax=Manis pentadactyla TaxID=143292 RepID=UPI00255CCF42|nr:uncharacterized protein LOC130683272 [Manis pentadactyla]